MKSLGQKWIQALLCEMVKIFSMYPSGSGAEAYIGESVQLYVQ